MGKQSDFNKPFSFRLDRRIENEAAIWDMLEEWKNEDGSIRPKMIAALEPYAVGEKEVVRSRAEDRIAKMLADFLERLSLNPANLQTFAKAAIQDDSGFDDTFREGMRDLFDQSK